MLNRPDGTWNNGESPNAADVGGMLGIDATPPVLGTDVHIYSAWANETLAVAGDGPIPPLSGVRQRMRGYFLPPTSPPLPPNGQVTDGAFDITAEFWHPGMPIVIVISTPQTIAGVGVTDGIAPDLGRFAYPGWGWPSGLGRHLIPGGGYAENNATNVRLMLKNPGTYNMICAGYVARISGRPFVFELQRVLQLVQTVQAMLKDPTGVWRPPGWQAQDMDQPVMIEGGSFGGWVAQWAVLLFPEHFHGAFSSAGGEGMRLSWQQQELWRYGTTLSGFTASGRDYGVMDTLQVAAGMWQYRNYRVGTANPAPWATWSPFFHTSITREWRDGRLYWPVYYVLSDEDVTADGTDFLPLFDGIPAYHDHGWIPGPPAIYWSVKDKATHSGGLHTTAIGNLPTWEHHDDQLEFLPQVINSYWNFVNSPPTPHPLPTYQPPGVVNQTMDSYEHVYANVAPPGTPAPGVLKLDQTYPGAGTTLGGGDSLQVANGFVYVGSAEGVVTRLSHSPAPVPGLQVTGWNLRNTNSPGISPFDQQSLRLFPNPSPTDARTLIALGTAGGSLIVLRPGVPGGSPPDIGAVLGEGDDLGDGGMALALHDAGDRVDIYFGVVAHHATNVNHASMPQAANTPADDLVGALAVYRWNGALALQQLIVFDGSSAPGRKAFGICGLKVGDVIPGNGTDELVVTTLDGQMFVYALVAGSGMIASGLPLYQVQLAGSLGMFNSIEIGDFDNDGKVEVYVAGSLALRRFEQP